ncbi:energy transducer TonB [Hymenobacter fastidiosus]|uniref:energy transducer TonB n=1 Tax=Hymenobacter fastidiosus TaxID=486264 RepID=UPI0031EDADD9
MPLLPAADAAGHLPLSVLREYVAGTLPAAGQHRIEAHAQSCSRCAEVLEGLAVSDLATTDAALATLRTRLHQRLAQEAAPRDKVIAWRAMAAVLVLLGLSTMAWFGLRPTPELVGSKQVALTRPAAPRRVAPKMSAPVAVEANQAAATAASAELTPPDRPTGASAPVAARRVGRQRAVAAKRPTRSAPVTAPDQSAAATAMIGAGQPAPDANTVAPAAAPTADMGASPASPVPADTAVVSAARAKPLAGEGAARKANLPPALTISPQPVSGYRALREYLNRENKFIPESPARQLPGAVRLKFTVTAAGKLENFRVVKGMRADYDAEAIRLICEGPAWQAGVANGRRADQVVEISISF